ncbi:MAG: YmfQ family protein [Oscillospiraceae bacterium]|nr:YmfQ family protein [Oscillospiraceae bacterium]MDE7171205.1 YmfQ family protein [Oscillospiraceae bacterium]
MTLRFEDYLVSLLRPLGVYDLRAGTINRGELAAYGARLDGAEAELDHTAREMNLTTAEDFGLERIEALLPYRPVCVTAEQRREALAALLRISGDSFTPEAINDTLRGCGLNARAEETGRPGYVDVYFPDVAGIPEGFDQLRVIIEEILPSHLGITYVFWYNTWAMVAGWHPTFGDAAASGLSWYGLAIENDGFGKNEE